LCGNQFNYDGAIILTAAYALPNPTALIHIHSSIRQEYYPLFLKDSSSDLREASARDGAVLHHNALPGQAVRAEAHGAAYLPRRAGPAQHSGDLAVGHDLARRHLRHDVIDLLIKWIHKPSPNTSGMGYKKTAIYLKDSGFL
jgi:hypothetical protein